VPRVISTPRVLRLADESANPTPASLPVDRDEGSSPVPTVDPIEAIRQLPQVGALAPDFTLHTIDGLTVTLSALRGHPVLINFWASWCIACRAEAPELQKLYLDNKDRGLTVLGVNVTQQDTIVAAQAYAAQFQLTFPLPLDEQGDVFKAYHVPGLPTSFFVDSKGIIRNVIVGQMDQATMLESLKLTMGNTH
jgi:peroxiredoxin